MSDNEKKIAEIHLSNLKQEIVVESRNLSTILKSQEAAKKEAALIDSKKAQDLKDFAEAKARLEEDRKNFLREKQDHDKFIEAAKREVFEIKEKARDATKDLNWILDKVRKEEGIYNVLSLKNSELEADIKKRTEILSDIKDLQEAVRLLSEKKSNLQKENSDIIDASLMKLSQVREEIHTLQKAEIETVEKRNKAEYELKEFNDQLEKKKHDLSVYVSRVEKYYKKAFPELVMKL